MTILEMIYLGTLCLAILSCIFFILCLFLWFRAKGKLKKLPKKRFKNPKKRKKFKLLRKKLEKSKSKQLRNWILFLIFGLLFAGSAVFVSYYQTMNLSEDDSDSIVQGYNLVADFEAQIVKAGSASDSETKISSNLRYLSNAIASYGNKKGSRLNSEEGQILLNRYYYSMEELGKNASKLSSNFYENQKLVDEFLTDVEKVKEHQKKVLDYFKVDEASLQAEKN